MVSMSGYPLVIGDKVAPLPIVQGGMGVKISVSGLASAVINEGGVGVIAAADIGMDEPDFLKDPSGANIRALRAEIRKTRELSDGILGVNIMVALVDFEALVCAAVEEGADIIFSGAGLPMKLPGLIPKNSKTKIVPIVSSARAANLILRNWISRFDYIPDAFVVEGPKAGGHLGFKKENIDDPNFALEKLVLEVIQELKTFVEEYGREIPVIAAGGIYTGADIFKFLQLGASAVQMATRFVATHECDADVGFKQAYIDAKESDIGIIESPVGMPGRALLNVFIEKARQGTKIPIKCPYKCIKTCKLGESPYCISFALMNAQRGKVDQGVVFCGSNVHRVKAIVSVYELVESLKNEFEVVSSLV